MSAGRSRRLGLPVACLWLYTVHAGKIGCTDPPSLDFGGGLLPLGITDASCQVVLTVACGDLAAPAFSAVLGGNGCTVANVCTTTMSTVNVALGYLAAAAGLPQPIVWTPPASLEPSDRVYDACPSTCALYSSSPGCISPPPPAMPDDARLDETATIRIDAHETTHPINVATGGSWELVGRIGEACPGLLPQRGQFRAVISIPKPRARHVARALRRVAKPGHHVAGAGLWHEADLDRGLRLVADVVRRRPAVNL